MSFWSSSLHKTRRQPIRAFRFFTDTVYTVEFHRGCIREPEAKPIGFGTGQWSGYMSLLDLKRIRPLPRVVPILYQLHFVPFNPKRIIRSNHFLSQWAWNQLVCVAQILWSKTTHLKSRRRMSQNPFARLISRHIRRYLSLSCSSSVILSKGNQLPMTMSSIAFVIWCTDAISPYCVTAFDPHACATSPTMEELLTFLTRKETLENWNAYITRGREEGIQDMYVP